MLSKDTLITSVMDANSLIGTIEPIVEISRLVHDKVTYLHVGAVASQGRIPMDVQKYGIDLLTISTSDMYGPQEAGALYASNNAKLQTILVGGGQESGLRPGTENLFAITGMGEAGQLANLEMNQEREAAAYNRSLLEKTQAL